MPKRVHVLVTGRVQGVSYRYSTREEATRLGLVGWVRNLVDGGVELEAEGDAATVDTLVAWCGHGPPYARVERATATEIATVGTESEFVVRR